MDTSVLATQAQKIFDKIIYITLATVSIDGEPWNSPVYTAYDDSNNFYWMSWKKNQHSLNIEENGKVFAVIYDSTVPESTGVGVYMKGTAVSLHKTNIKEMIHALRLLYERKDKKPRKPSEFLDILPRRIYKFTPDQIWINGGSDIDGNFIDTRTDITSELIS